MFPFSNRHKQRLGTDIPHSKSASYFSVDREEELRNATWEEIDAIAEKIHGQKPAMKRSDVRIPYAGSPYIMDDRIGSLDESNTRWEKLGNP